jgi:hypothetical protein
VATFTINLSIEGQLKLKQKALAEAISKAMMTDEPTQTALQNVDLGPIA